MLKSNQIRRLQTTEHWLREINPGFKGVWTTEYCLDVTLGYAIQAVGELLQKQEVCNYKSCHVFNLLPPVIQS